MNRTNVVSLIRNRIILKLTLSLLCTPLIAGCSQPKSTHHCLIRIGMPSSLTKDERLAEFDEIVAIVDRWAAENQLDRMPQDRQHEQRMQSFSSDPESQRVVSYRERNAPSSRWAVEAMATFNPEHHPYVIRLSMTEGYRQAPSEQLNTLYSSLLRTLNESNKNLLSTSIW